MSILKPLLKLWPYIQPHQRWLWFSLFMAIPLSLLRAGPIPLLKMMVDDLLVNRREDRLYLLPLVVIGLYSLNVGIRFLHYFAIRIVVVRVNQAVRQRLYEKLLSLSTDYFSQQKGGALLSRLTADPHQLDSGIASFNTLIREPVTLLALLGYALFTNWKLTVLTFTILPILAFVFGKTGKYIKQKISQYQSENGESYGVLQETIQGIRVIHSFNLQSEFLKRYTQQLNRISHLLLRISRMEELVSPTVEWVTSIAIATILYFGGKAVLDGEMTSGDLFAFFTSFAMMMNPIRQMSDVNTKVFSAAAAMERIEDFLSWKPTLLDPKEPCPAPSEFESLEFKNVSFFYPDDDTRRILNEVSFKIEKGQTLALVGASGSGKSTISQLVQRVYLPTSGSIQINGQGIEKYSAHDLRSLFSWVSQDVFLFHDTIFENIRMGRPDATESEIIEASRRAYAYEFIQKLPHGLQTIVGDRGAKLSGGEKQRISIARAFLKNSPFLILDEATSNLDHESEREVQKSLEELIQNRTTLIIAHRLSTIKNADRIEVVKDGEIVESGTYNELWDRLGEFRRLANLGQ